MARGTAGGSLLSFAAVAITDRPRSPQPHLPLALASSQEDS
uniref:Uncharacterized protein n=1 Tax=Arundo donax TaxID=35708 RepID=A0A0A9H6G1_ARUDO